MVGFALHASLRILGKIMLPLSLVSGLPAHATHEYGQAWGGVYVPATPDSVVACTNVGGEAAPENNCIFPDGVVACLAAINYYKQNSPDGYGVYNFVSWGIPYVDNMGNAISTQVCILSDSRNPSVRYTMDGSFPILQTLPVVRCSLGSLYNDDWRAYVPGNPTSLPKCSLELPPKNKFCSSANSATADPINIGTGNKWLRETDYSGAGTALRFERTYNLIEPIAWGNLGYGWTHTYSRLIKSAVGSQQATAKRADGKEFVFNFDAANATWVTDADIIERLIELKDGTGARTGWRYITESDDTETFDLNGRLMSVAARNGQTQTLVYSNASTPTSVAPVAGLLIEVSDAFARSVKLTYDSTGRINTVTGANGEVNAYGYTSYTYSSRNYARLSTVTQPGGAVKTYLYEGSSGDIHALTGVIDENNNRVLTWGFDGSGRAVSSQRGGNVANYSISRTRDASFNTTSAIVTDPLGTQRTYSFQTILGVVKTTGVSQPCPSCGGTQSQATAYDANGNISSRTDFNNKKSCMAYDLARNLETARIEGLLASEDCAASLSAPPNRPDVRKTSTTWHPTYRLPLTITEPAAAATTGATAGVAGSKLTQFIYDANGNLLQKDVTAPKNDGSSATELRSWKWTYNALGQVLTAKDPLNNATNTA